MKFCSLLALLAVVVTALGCSHDPQVRKQKYFESGQRYFEQGKYREAIIQFSNAVQVDARFAEAHHQVARTYLKLEQWNSAYAELSRTLELQPENYDAHLDMANLLISAHDLPQAKTHIDLLLKQQPGNASVHLAAANLLGPQGDVFRAIQEAQSAIELAPTRWEPYVVMAILRESNHQPDIAELNFKKALELNPKATNARLGLADFLRMQGRMAEAEEQIHTATENDSNNTDPPAALVRLYEIEGKGAAAEEFLKHVKQQFPENSVGYRMLGDYYFAIGDLEKAAIEYSSLYHNHPKDPRVKLNYVQLLILRGQLQDARRLNDEILKENPGSDEALICRGQIQIREALPGDAVETLQHVLTNNPNNAVAHYHLGVAYLALGKLQLAENEWQGAVRLNSDLVEAQRALAQTALKKGDATALEHSASEIIKLQPLSAEGYALRSAAYISRQRYDFAEADIRKAIDMAPAQSTGYLQMGNLRFAQRQFGDAERAYQEALDRDPNSSEALAGLMNACLAQKRPDKAIAAAQAQIRKFPDNSAFHDLLGTLLFDSRHDVPGAEAALEKSIELDKNNSDAVIKLGRLQVAKGSLDAAIAVYQTAIKNNPGSSDLYILTGELYENKHDWENAKQMYQRALEMNPNNPLASNNLAYTLLQTGGNVDLALSLAQTARRGMPNSPNAADTLGWVYYRKGAFQSAIDQFHEALQLIDKNKVRPDANVHYHLALAYEKTNQPALARQQLQRVLKINPNYDNAEDVKKQLAELRS